MPCFPPQVIRTDSSPYSLAAGARMSHAHLAHPALRRYHEQQQQRRSGVAAASQLAWERAARSGREAVVVE